MWQWFMVGATILRGILHRGTSWVVKPEGLLGDGFTHGHPGPLAFTWQSITAWAMAHLPSWIVMGSAAR